MEFDDILEEIQQVMDKHGVELIIKSEISFKKLDGGSYSKKANPKAKSSSKEDNRKPNEG